MAETMQKPFGVVKPADPAEKHTQKKRNPKPPPAPTSGQHKPFAHLANAEKKAAIEAKEAAKKSAAEKKESEKAAAKKAAEDAKFGAVRKYAAEAKKRHPKLPDDIYNNVWNSKTKGEAKRIVRDYLIKIEAPVEV